MLTRKKPREVLVDPAAQIQAMADQINKLRAELDTYLDEYAHLTAPPGVPWQNVRMMMDGGSKCLCGVATRVLARQAADLDLQQRAEEKKK